MKKQQGFAMVLEVVLVAIVLAVVAVAGYHFYLVKSSTPAKDAFAAHQVVKDFVASAVSSKDPKSACKKYVQSDAQATCDKFPGAGSAQSQSLLSALQSLKDDPGFDSGPSSYTNTGNVYTLKYEFKDTTYSDDGLSKHTDSFDISFHVKKVVSLLGVKWYLSVPAQ